MKALSKIARALLDDDAFLDALDAIAPVLDAGKKVGGNQVAPMEAARAQFMARHGIADKAELAGAMEELNLAPRLVSRVAGKGGKAPISPELRMDRAKGAEAAFEGELAGGSAERTILGKASDPSVQTSEPVAESIRSARSSMEKATGTKQVRRAFKGEARKRLVDEGLVPPLKADQMKLGGEGEALKPSVASAADRAERTMAEDVASSARDEMAEGMLPGLTESEPVMSRAQIARESAFDPGFEDALIRDAVLGERPSAAAVIGRQPRNELVGAAQVDAAQRGAYGQTIDRIPDMPTSRLADDLARSPAGQEYNESQTLEALLGREPRTVAADRAPLSGVDVGGAKAGTGAIAIPPTSGDAAYAMERLGRGAGGEAKNRVPFDPRSHPSNAWASPADAPADPGWQRNIFGGGEPARGPTNVGSLDPVNPTAPELTPYGTQMNRPTEIGRGLDDPGQTYLFDELGMSENDIIKIAPGFQRGVQRPRVGGGYPSQSPVRNDLGEWSMQPAGFEGTAPAAPLAPDRYLRRGDPGLTDPYAPTYGDISLEQQVPGLDYPRAARQQRMSDLDALLASLQQ